MRLLLRLFLGQNNTSQRPDDRVLHGWAYLSCLFCCTGLVSAYQSFANLASQGRREDWGAQGKYKEWGPEIRIVGGGWGCAPRKFWDFTCSRVCSGGSWGSFFVHAHSTYRYTCKMPSSISGFRSKSTMYGALASGLRSRIKRKAKLYISNIKL